jgi:protein TonB
LLAALLSVVVAGAGTSYADTISADPNYAGRPHMGLMDPAPSAIPPGTGGIKPVRPIHPSIPVRPVKPIPRPKPKPRPVVDPNIVGYAADGTPIYPWGPKPLPPQPVKPSKGDLVPVGEVDPYQTPPIIPPRKLPPAPEVR